jgi:hypothetical protein
MVILDCISPAFLLSILTPVLAALIAMYAVVA